MKKNLLFILFFVSLSIFAQQKLFQTKLNESSLTVQQKLTPELNSNYLFTNYYHQTPFELQGKLEIALPSNRVIKASFSNKFTYSNKAVSYVYKIENEAYSELVLSKYENIITGLYVSQNGEKVVFHQTQPNIFAISEVNQPKLDQQEKKDDFIIAPDEGNKSYLVNPDICSSSTQPCPATVIDVMVLYTTDAKNIWGGAAQSNANLATAITNFNTSLINSGVNNTTINLVYSGEISYTESGNISTDLSRLRSTTDGFMDDAHTLRATYGADLVSLVTATPTNTCGLGYLNFNPTNYVNTSAFTVSLYNCAISNYTIAHEMGHNMGLNHDWFVDTDTTPCSHHHGYVNQTAVNLGTSSPSSSRWRTIMAYSNQCTGAGINCTRINRWANPNINYNGEPTGKPITDAQPSDEAFGFLRFACVVANFMPTVQMGTAENNTKSDDLFIYQNTNSEKIEIHFKGGKNNVFKVLNVVGQKVLETKEKQFSIAHWTKGTYILAVHDSSNNLLATKKFIVK